MSDFPSALFINGDFRKGSSDKRIRLVNPADEEVIAEVESADVAEVNAAVEGANRAWQRLARSGSR